MGILEVALRNQINDVLTAHFTDPDWIIHQKSGFMSHSSLTYRNKKSGKMVNNDFLKREVQKAEDRLRKKGAMITSGKIIAEQTFGFWTDLFEVHHYKLLSGRPIQIFRTLPSGFGRKEVHEALTKIRLFRNRISHNEPVCFIGSKIDLTEVVEVHDSIQDILQWIDPQLLKFVADMDKVAKSIDATRRI